MIGLFAAYAKDQVLRIRSSSGGIFALLARMHVRNGGVVFGASWDSCSRSVKHVEAEDESALERLSGSKYAQSDLTDCFLRVRCFLEAGRSVLFSGVPCQLAGLRNFLKRDYENLFTVEIVCHGVSSPLVLRRFLDAVAPPGPCNVRFRDKSRGWKEYSFLIEKSDGGVICESKNDNVFLKGFLSNLYLRQSCSFCLAQNKMRGDIVLADYWSINTVNPSMDDNLGVSAVIVMTEKGSRMFERLSDETVSVSTPPLGFFVNNRNVMQPSPMHPRRKRFFAALAKGDIGIIELTQHNIKWPVFRKMCWKASRHFNKKKMRRLASRVSKGECI